MGGGIVYLFIVTLQPLSGTPGGPQTVRMEVPNNNINAVKRLAEAQYGRMYRVSNVSSKGRIGN